MRISDVLVIWFFKFGDMVILFNLNVMIMFCVLWDSGKSGLGCGGCFVIVSCIVECFFRNSFIEYLWNCLILYVGEGDGLCRKSWRNVYNGKW